MMPVCHLCQTPVDDAVARRGVDGELYHPRHVSTITTPGTIDDGR
jgi:hypothetical protein